MSDIDNIHEKGLLTELQALKSKLYIAANRGRADEDDGDKMWCEIIPAIKYRYYADPNAKATIGLASDTPPEDIIATAVYKGANDGD